MRPVLLDMPMSSSMRQRDWMFSSVASGARPANSSFQRGRASPRTCSRSKARCIFTPRVRACAWRPRAHVRGIARRHHDRLHLLRPSASTAIASVSAESIPPDSPMTTPGKPCLLHVVAHAEHERVVDARLIAKLGHDRARPRRAAPSLPRANSAHVQCLPRRRARASRARPAHP